MNDETKENVRKLFQSIATMAVKGQNALDDSQESNASECIETIREDLNRINDIWKEDPIDAPKRSDNERLADAIFGKGNHSVE